jgi:hypothetical protein
MVTKKNLFGIKLISELRRRKIKNQMSMLEKSWAVENHQPFFLHALEVVEVLDKLDEA